MLYSLCPIHSKREITERYNYLYCPICYEWLDGDSCSCIDCVNTRKFKGKNAKIFLVLERLRKYK